MAAKKLTGKASTISIGSANLTVTKYTPKVTRTLAKSQGSDNYDTASDMLTPEQLPVGYEMDVAVEGRYDLNSTPTAIIAILFTGATPVDVVMGLDAGNLFGHGKFDLADFETGVIIDDTVNFTCSLKLNGKFTPGA